MRDDPEEGVALQAECRCCTINSCSKNRPAQSGAVALAAIPLTRSRAEDKRAMVTTAAQRRLAHSTGQPRMLSQPQPCSARVSSRPEDVSFPDTRTTWRARPGGALLDLRCVPSTPRCPVSAPSRAGLGAGTFVGSYGPRLSGTYCCARTLSTRTRSLRNN